ncbi:PepSY-associated TM helix domain-containing protein [Cronobacter turicensis]|uniref:PepSY-associated TM helix domain-containing protein n=1 Tax=unclassified Cronobacter TaxID=2649764 RepID=UPI0013ED55C0|nr:MULTISPECIES: PepSY-associated TM helix domain-containing protein [unclassified Cronobacter]ELQ6226508.1 PepSY domain-containing protein [Cronobacter turicensis]KAF6590623.1 PepSY domain-containing protein [Cronobacter sp. EKM101R]KAF6592917.1 PepSY domain-containing protein [Cronobacter sp. EKM102R]
MTSCTPRAAWVNLLRRLHFYTGLFIGPFIFIAALTGTLYVATPQLENWLYRDALSGATSGSPQPLAQQIAVAEQKTGGELRLSAVRPALTPGETTRVMFADPSLGESESRAIFIDPVTLAVKGDLTVYGTSGILPLRQWIDYAHRSLLLGNVGRVYSELAASWMWVSALGGIALWCFTRPKRRMKNAFQTTRRLHTGLGWVLLAGMLLFSATGLTWSQWAGANVDKMRAAFDWLTPQVNTQLHGGAQAHDPHAEHHMHHGAMNMPALHIDARQYDQVLQAARNTGIDARRLEIRPPREDGRAWTVTEIDRAWPTQVDAAAVDGATLQVIDTTRFADYPLMAKLTRWGVDFHMGILFGLPNQLLLIAFGIALCVAIALGYRLWWLRRPQGPLVSPAATLSQGWLNLPVIWRVITIAIAALLGLALPVMGVSLAILVVMDHWRWRQGRRKPLAQDAV